MIGSCNPQWLINSQHTQADLIEPENTTALKNKKTKTNLHRNLQHWEQSNQTNIIQCENNCYGVMMMDNIIAFLGKCYFINVVWPVEKAFLAMTHMHCHWPSMPAIGNQVDSWTIQYQYSLLIKKNIHIFIIIILQCCCKGGEDECYPILTLLDILQKKVVSQKTIVMWQNQTSCGLVVRTLCDH